MKTLILGANIVNEGVVDERDVLINGTRIERIGKDLSALQADRIIQADDLYLLPGLIDDQVHFREPGLTHKGTIFTESRAAVAGGVTTYMEMPNTFPPALSQDILQNKYDIAAKDSLANYSFYMGASDHNLEEVMRTDLTQVCGLKIFMGSSTGDLLVDDDEALRNFFRAFPGLIAVHCEDEQTVRNNLRIYREKFGDNIPPEYHPDIRSREACYLSSSKAVALAKQYGTRLHVLHISTAEEIELFDDHLPITQKKITAEACIHHLWFDRSAYARAGNFIKWNPAIKDATDRAAIWAGLHRGKIDVIATDHAPHTIAEKSEPYVKAPSGGPLVQHALVSLLEHFYAGNITLPWIVQRVSHNPAELFRIVDRGYLREGYYADLVLVDLDAPWEVSKENILYKCGWSPFEGYTFKSKVTHTWVSGHLAYERGQIDSTHTGKRISFRS